jgi:hemoglobin-like flavoprotein
MSVSQISSPTSKNIELVQRSWLLVEPIADVVVVMFYERLFVLDPSIKPMFTGDFESQKKKFMQTLRVTINGFQHASSLGQVLERLGARHTGFMVEERHYKVFGEALLWALGESLGKEFTPGILAAWQEVYHFITTHMKHGASQLHLAASSKSYTQTPAKSSVVRAVRAYPSASPSSVLGIPPKQIELLQKSWDAVVPILDVAATLFYDRLFAIDPSAKALFTGDFESQKKKLMQTIGGAVKGLQTPSVLIGTLERLGVRHVGYLVEERHYKSVGEALLWTLQEGLGDAFTPEVSSAWVEFYEMISSNMKRAATKFIASSLTQTHSIEPSKAAAPPFERAPKPSLPNKLLAPSLEPAPETPISKASVIAIPKTPEPVIPQAPIIEFPKEYAHKIELLTTKINAEVSGALSVTLEKDSPLRLLLSADPALLAVLEKLPNRPAVAEHLLYKLCALLGLLGGGAGLLIALLPSLQAASSGALGVVVLSLATIVALSFALGLSFGRSASKKTETT